jgi:mannitol/fructose-specific phosphotransferase system IIA component (Ntr-type)
MRESRIEGYDPGFRSPLYPWMQVAGFVIPIWLIAELGWFSLLFTAAVVALSAGWYRYHGLGELPREGAIYHVFERLGRQRYDGLDRELRQILEEKEFRKVDPFEEVVARAVVLDMPGSAHLDDIVERVAHTMAPDLHLSPEEMALGFRDGARAGAMPVAHGAAFPHLRLRGVQFPRISLVRCRDGVTVETDGPAPFGHEPAEPVRALFFLISPETDTGQHLRILGQLAARVDEADFMDEWLSADDAQQLKEVLLRHEHSLALRIRSDAPSAELIGRRLRDIDLPQGTLIALIRRESRSIIPRGDTALEAGDRVTIIGDPDVAREWTRRSRSRRGRQPADLTVGGRRVCTAGRFINRCPAACYRFQRG